MTAVREGNSRRADRLRKIATWAYEPIWRLPGVHQVLRPVAQVARRRWFVRDLQRLHDTLEGTDLAGRYWMWAGLLLGWAREGRPLLHDSDADFALRAEDLPLLEGAVPNLRSAGFRPSKRFVNNEGSLTELQFECNGDGYDFFLMEPVGAMWRYYSYGGPRNALVQCECRLPVQSLAPFEFLGRQWLKSSDHEAELRAIYGDWKTPNKAWSYIDDELCIVRREPWNRTDMRWTG